MAGQSHKGTTAEIITNMVLGWFINVGILIIFGMPVIWSSTVGIIMIPVSMLRHYGLRRFFNWLYTKGVFQ